MNNLVLCQAANGRHKRLYAAQDALQPRLNAAWPSVLLLGGLYTELWGEQLGLTKNAVLDHVNSTPSAITLCRPMDR